MDIGDELFQAAISLAEKRYPAGWAGAAAVRTASGCILTSVAPEVKNDALSLCMEVGAYLEAQKLDDAVTHSLCVSREREDAPFLILTPCGICQERLAYWGEEVQAAVTNPNNEIVFKTLKELQPFHWSSAFRDR